MKAPHNHHQCLNCPRQKLQTATEQKRSKELPSKGWSMIWYGYMDMWGVCFIRLQHDTGMREREICLHAKAGYILNCWVVPGNMSVAYRRLAHEKGFYGNLTDSCVGCIWANRHLHEPLHNITARQFSCYNPLKFLCSPGPGPCAAPGSAMYVCTV